MENLSAVICHAANDHCCQWGNKACYEPQYFETAAHLKTDFPGSEFRHLLEKGLMKDNKPFDIDGYMKENHLGPGP